MFFANFYYISDLSLDLAPSDQNLMHPTSRQIFGDAPGQTPKLILTLCHNLCSAQCAQCAVCTVHSVHWYFLKPDIVFNNIRYDVALLRLDRPAYLQPHVLPICLPTPTSTEGTSSNHLDHCNSICVLDQILLWSQPLEKFTISQWFMTKLFVNLIIW